MPNNCRICRIIAELIKAVLYVKEKGKITNGEYQEIWRIYGGYGAGKQGAGSFYELIGQIGQ